MHSQKMVRTNSKAKPRFKRQPAGEVRWQKYIRRLDKRPPWAERYMRRISTDGALPTRCLDGRFWMCLKAGFRPMRDEHWDWWCGLNWPDQNWFYELGMQWWRMSAQVKRKGDPERQFAGMR